MPTNINITTRPFNLTPQQYFNISLRRSLRTIFLVLGLYFSIGVAFLFIHDIVFAVIFFLAIPILLGMFLWRIKRLTHTKENKALFIERYLTIDETYLCGYVKDGAESKVPLTNIVKIISTKTYFLLYLSKLTFIYLPYTAFVTPADQQTATELFKKLGLLRS